MEKAGGWVVRLNDHGDTSTQTRSRTINWEPQSAYRTSDGGTQSPLLGLGHEFGHAAGFIRDPEAVNTRVSISHGTFTTLEEEHVIFGLEKNLAEQFGESIRSDH